MANVPARSAATQEPSSKYEEVQWAEMLESKPPGVLYYALRLTTSGNETQFLSFDAGLAVAL
jgi:hypothetical protein